MFSGIVERLAEVVEARRGPQGMRLRLDLGPCAEGVNIGDSIAINGCCLTVTRMDSTVASFDLVTETLDRTCLGQLTAGSRVNIERSLRIGDRLHGHFVQGHVDGTGRILHLERGPEGGEIQIEIDESISSQMIPKGSVAVDGISLTIVELHPAWFSIALIPHTLSITSLGIKKEGDLVNLEVDMIGKWVRRILEPPGSAAAESSGLTIDKLREAGF